MNEGSGNVDSFAIDYMPSTFTNQDLATSSHSEARTKRHFTSEEDSLLKELVRTHGMNQWHNISSHMTNRTARQCRDRWKNYLDPNLNKAPWTQEEDHLLMKLCSTPDNKSWSQIAKHFKGRTDTDIKNHYNKLKRRLSKSNAILGHREEFKHFPLDTIN